MLKTEKKFVRYDYRSSCTFYLFAIVLVLAAQGIGSGVAVALQWLLPSVDIASNGDFNAAFMIFVQALSCVFIFVYSHCMRKKFNFTVVKKEDGGNIALLIILPMICGVVLLVGMYLPTVWYGLLMEKIGIPEDYGNIKFDTPSAIAMTVIATVFLAPAFEEIIYRGVLLHGLRDRKSAVGAVMLSALAFMLMHMNPLQTVYQFVLGVLSAFIVLKTGRLLPAMILHATSNALALVVEYTALGERIGVCVEWCMANPVAAVFITIGIAAAAGALLFVLVKYAFGLIDIINKRRAGIEAADMVESDDATLTDEARAVQAVVAKQNSGTGTLMYWIAAGLSIGMLVMNLAAAIISGVMS